MTHHHKSINWDDPSKTITNYENTNENIIETIHGHPQSSQSVSKRTRKQKKSKFHKADDESSSKTPKP